MVSGECPWVLMGPWYRWSKPGDPAAGRFSRPVFQKYDTAKAVAEFLKNPQRSLKFLVPDDVHYDTVAAAPTWYGGRRQNLSAYTSVSSGVRKLYLDTHKRFYLVVCELHCDAPGLPNACRKAVCEAGFVVRRRTVRIPAGSGRELSRQLRAIAALEAQIARWVEPQPGGRTPLPAALIEEFRKKNEQAHAQFEQAVARYGIRLALEGWIPGQYERIGAWQEVEETPAAVAERVFPLYPLTPDPRVEKHAGAGRSLYFGLLPTSSLDSDVGGVARFDDRTLYEVRCFVRRHKPCCPRKPEPNDCNGELTWSRRSESYRLAPHFDLTGTSNHAVTIQMPDLRALEAQASSLPPGAGAPVKFVAPPESQLGFTVDAEEQKATPTAPGASICSFAIPLITIVAMFVFRLFLPVVTFLFGLFFLLRLRFCIPPSFSLSASLAAKLSANLDASANVDAQFEAALSTDLKATFGEKAGGAIVAQYSPQAQAEMVRSLAVDYSASLPEGLETSQPSGAPSPVKAPFAPLTARLEYEVEAPLP